MLPIAQSLSDSDSMPADIIERDAVRGYAGLRFRSSRPHQLLALTCRAPRAVCRQDATVGYQFALAGAGDPAPTQVGRGEEWSGVRSRREAPVVAAAEARVRRVDRVGDGRSGDRTGVAAWFAAVAADADVVQRTGDPDHGAAAVCPPAVPVRRSGGVLADRRGVVIRRRTIHPLH